MGLLRNALRFGGVVWVVGLMWAPPAAGADKTAPVVLKTETFRHYVEQFNADDEELYAHIANAKAWEFLAANVPLLQCPDKDIERTYYFRWWTYRKHVKKTPDGYVITEFLPPVPWAARHNTISCPAGHHFYEGRWLRNRRYMDDYAVFWFRKGGSPRRYSFWAADALYADYLVRNNRKLIVDLLDDLVKNYRAWERSRLTPDGLFWQIDDRDGMEVSVGKSGKRATINSYMYGDATAIAKIATMARRADVAAEYGAKAARLKHLVQTKLWDDKAKFFKTLKRSDGKNTSAALVDVREQHGFTPWYFNLPDANRGYEVAWKQLMDPKGFYAPFGPTTAEQRHPGFKVVYEGHGCQWNGPSWPLATAVTLTGMANVLNNYPQDAITRADYLKMLKVYTRCHRRKRADGRTVAWIDENIDPFTGVWIARKMLLAQDAKRRAQGRKSNHIKERGKDYNHSSYCDLVITGLVGLRPRGDDVVEVNPLVPAGVWDYFCLDHVAYHGRVLTIVWDKTGKKYGRGAGLYVLADGKEIARSKTLKRITGRLGS